MSLSSLRPEDRRNLVGGREFVSRRKLTTGMVEMEWRSGLMRIHSARFWKDGSGHPTSANQHCCGYRLRWSHDRIDVYPGPTNDRIRPINESELLEWLRENGAFASES